MVHSMACTRRDTTLEKKSCVLPVELNPWRYVPKEFINLNLLIIVKLFQQINQDYLFKKGATANLNPSEMTPLENMIELLKQI